MRSPSRTRVLLGTAALLALTANSTRAANEVDPFALSPEQLFDATVMSVSKSDEKLKDAPAAVYVLTNEAIMRSGATSIPEALRGVPGVQVARGNSSGWAISVRGFNSGLANKLLVLIDGREVYDALFSGVYWDIQDYPLEDIERIEVVRGPGATLWGANAVNGVINIITKKAAATQGTLASVIAGNQDKAIVTGRYGAGADKAHWRAYGKYLDRDNQETVTGGDAQDAWHALRGGFRADWDTDAEGNSFTLQGDAYSTDYGKLRSAPQLTAPYAVTVIEDNAAEGGNLLGRWTRAMNDGASVSLQMYADVTARRQFTLKDRRTTFDIDAQYDMPDLGAHDVVLGARYRYTESSLKPSSILTFDDATRADNLFSAFIQDKITLASDWFLTLGTKLEHNNYTGFEVQPSARLQWVDDEQTLWASASRAVRSPSRLEHDLTVLAAVFPPSISFPLPASLELRPSRGFESEELIAYEVGYRRQWTPALLMDLAAFYNVYDNLATLSFNGIGFETPPLHAVFPILTTNRTSGETYGFEAVVTWRALDNVDLSLAYSYLEIQLHGPSSVDAIASEAGEGQSPQNQLSLRAQWDVTDTLAFDTTVHYTDSLPGFSIAPYWQVDARLGWRMLESLTLELVGQNLLDETHREFGSVTDVSTTEVPRSFYGRLTWRQ